MQQCRLAVSRPVVQEGRVENDRIATAVEHEPAARPVNRHDGGAIAIVDIACEVTALDDDAVADRERAAGQHQLLGAKPPRLSHNSTGAGVQLRDVGAPVGDHDRRLGIVRRPPVADKTVVRRVGVALDHDPVVSVVQRERLVGPPFPEVLERHALPDVDLAAILGQLDREAALDEPAERAAGLDLLQLVVVADKNELPASSLDRLQYESELASRQHAGLVDDEDATLGERVRDIGRRR